MQKPTDRDLISAELSEWEKFVVKHPVGNIFQTPAVFNFFKNISNYDPVTVFSKDNRGNINGVLLGVIQREAGLAGFFSSRCIVWGGPLVKDNDPKIAAGLLKELDKKTQKRTIYTEFRNLFDTTALKKVFHTENYSYKPHYNFIVSIDRIRTGEKKISASKKRQINKSLKSGAQIVEPEALVQIKEFYAILRELYRTKVKKPLPGFDFFERFYESPQLGKYFLIKFNDKIIGGIMCPIYKDTIYEWYVCGLDGQYKGIYPSVLATWAPIDYAIKNGLKYFDFMGAGSPDADYGVREFKSRFGGDLVDYGRYIKVHKPVLFWIGKVGVRVLGWVRKVMKGQSNKVTR